MRIVEVYRNDIMAGTLTEESRQRFIFNYEESYYNDQNKPAISLTLPKTQKQFISENLFPFFCNMLSEGVNRKLQSKQLKIDEDDDFGLLIATAQFDAIGAVTVKPKES
jgi:HipA-like protein